MMRLKRVYETAEEEGRSVEEVALERYGSMEAFEEVLEERRILDERAGKRSNSQPPKKERAASDVRYSFYDSSGPPSRGSFRKPGEAALPTPPEKMAPPVNRRLGSLRTASGPSTPQTQQDRSSPSSSATHTPIPSVLTPQMPSTPPVDLNKMQAKVLRAKLMNAPNAEELEREYEDAKRRSEGFFNAEGKKLQILPTVDGQGRLYDVGTGKTDESGRPPPGNRRKKEKVRAPTALGGHG